MKPSRTWWLNLGLAVTALAAAALAYPRLPDLMPTHWGLTGVADGFTPKPWGPFVLPLAMLVLLGAFSALPALSPKGFSLEGFRRAYDFIITTVTLLLFLVTMLSLAAGLGAPVPMAQAVVVGLGLLLVVIGNFLGKVTRNFYLGIRTPWTLASEEVWLRTHRLGGKLFVAVGLAVVACGLLQAPAPVLIALVVAAALIPVIYSFAISRKLERLTPGSGEPSTGTPPGPPPAS